MINVAAKNPKLFAQYVNLVVAAEKTTPTSDSLYDLSNLSVEEAKTLQAILTKATVIR